MTEPRVYACMVRLFVFLFLIQTVAAEVPGPRVVTSAVAPVFAEKSEGSEQVTQVLQGDIVELREVKGEWASVLVSAQYRTPRGYPGWIKAKHLGAAGDGRSGYVTVSYPLVYLRETPGVEAPVKREAYLSTRLPLAADLTARTVGGERWLPVRPAGISAAVWVRASQVSEEEPVTLRRGDVIPETARLFEGTPYLWGGMTRHGIDCSGLTYSIYRLHGITIPRDADQQFQVGEPVSRDDLQPGDLVFFGPDGDITHVGIYSGEGRFVHASSGSGVVESPLFSGWYLQNYRGARRLLSERGGEPKKMVPAGSEVSR